MFLIWHRIRRISGSTTMRVLRSRRGSSNLVREPVV
nr:MAG TPA: hypothetical protein [Caudoviricetes sp.]